jgi:hypothetical protein
MLGTPARSFLSLAAAALALAAASPAGAATHPAQISPIGPNQFFKGLVNGHPPGQAIIFVSCQPGAKTGHPVGAQLEVEPAPSTGTTDTGFTGTNGTSIGAAVGPSASTTIILKFTSYGVKKSLPATLVLPCSGAGQADFIPAPHSSNAITAVLPVTFGPPPAR